MTFLYMTVMTAVTYLVRMIPFTVFRRPIQSRFVKRLLYYIPYAVLTAMAVPAIFFATDNVITAAVGTGVALILALVDCPLIVVAVGAAASAFVTGLFL